MLLYNKAHDPYHTLFRLLNVIIRSTEREMEHDRLRVYDFLVAFPVHISKLSLSKELQKEKTPFKQFANPYNNFDPYFLFSSMKPIQDAVIFSLSKAKILQQQNQNQQYSIHKENFTDELAELTKQEITSPTEEAIKFINDFLSSYELYGPKGLKAVSHLMEFRYDAIQANSQNK